MEIRLIHITENPLEVMCKAADMSYMTNHRDYDTIIRKIIKLGHTTVLEHATATFRISNISRACSHQFVRHRLMSIVQRSQRFVDETKFEYIIPESIKENYEALEIFEHCIRETNLAYNILRKDFRIKKEDARFVLPNACRTDMVVTANLRQWKYMIQLRGERHAQWEIRRVFLEILKILKREVPVVFEDLIINSKTETVIKT